MQQSHIRLSDAEPGTFAIMMVQAPNDPHVLRLCQMGLVPEGRIQLLRRGKRGSPFLIKVNQIVLCLDETLACNFLVVQEVES